MGAAQVETPENPHARTHMIFQQIPKVMDEVGAIGKNGVNKDQNYKFRSIDDVYNHLQPALQKHKVFFVPKMLDRKEEVGQTRSGAKQYHVTVTIEYTIYAEDGSSIVAVFSGEGMDTSDKATNKAATAAFKYMLLQIFCIAVAELADADKDSPEMAAKPQANATQKTDAKKESKPAAPPKEDLQLLSQAKDAVAKFRKVGVTEKQILERYKVKALSGLNATNVAELFAIGKAIVNKQKTVADYFEVK